MMPDKETVITHLQIIHTWASFARERDLQFFTAKHLENIAEWTDDALELLKEQKAVVRCKNCKKGILFNHEAGVVCTNHIINYFHKPDDFCSDGERKETK